MLKRLTVNLRFAPLFAVIIMLPLLAACSGADVQAPDQNPMPHDTLKGPGMFSGESGDILAGFRKGDDSNGGASIGVNGYLWRATLDTISFMPIVQADSAGGVIVTDWYANPSKTAERYRMNVFIRGRVLRADAIKVEVFKQAKKAGEWVDVEVTKVTETSLEDTILTKARSLRVADRVGK